jgi:serine/threonine protein kinase
MAHTASHSPNHCPDRQVLLAFHEGALSEPEIENVGSHLANCESCLQFLDRQHADPSAEGSSKSSLLDDTAIERIRSDPKFQEMVALVKRIDLAAVAETTPWPPPAESPALEPDGGVPERIGRYFVVKPLGRGGFADVYLASDPEHQRLVAIKVPRADRLTSSRRIEDFLQEARTTATLNHPNILPVYDFDRLPGGSCYVVMKYIEGRSLDRAISAERLGFARIADICVQIAEALDYAHNKRFIHRDIKPANILLDTAGTVYVADFGLAIHEETQHAHKDEFAGTCAYMSPEQIGPGTAHYFDHRTDIWSLGVVMYELLTRETPFAGRSDAVRIDKILNQPIRTPRSIDRSVPEELERICLSCLERPVEDRCASARELADRLRAWQGNSQRMAPPRRFLKGRSWLAAAVVSTVGIALLLVLAWQTNWRSFLPGRGIAPSAPPVAGGFKGVPPLVDLPIDSPPRNIVGDLNGRAVFDGRIPQYSVESTTSRWVARMTQVQSDTVQLHADLSVKDWVGTGGFAWQIVEPGEKQLKNNRWFTAEFYRSAKEKPCRLMVRELQLGEFGLVVDNSILFRSDVPLPRTPSAPLDILIQEKSLTITFNKNPPIQVSTPIKEVNSWIDGGNLVLAFTGFGDKITFGGVRIAVSPKK